MNQAQEVVNSSHPLHPTCPRLPFTPISYPFSNKLIPICLHANLTIISIPISHPPRISSPPYPFLIFHATHTHHSSFIPYITIHQICHPLIHQFISINTFAFMPIISIIMPTFSLPFHTSHVYVVICLSQPHHIFSHYTTPHTHAHFSSNAHFHTHHYFLVPSKPAHHLQHFISLIMSLMLKKNHRSTPTLQQLGRVSHNFMLNGSVHVQHA